MKVEQIKNDLVNWRKLSLGKIAKYISFIVGSIILICALTFILFPDPFINTIFKEQITKAFTETYPEYSIQLGDMHYNVWGNRLECDSITLKNNNSTITCSVASFSVSRIGWMKILWQRDFTLNNLTSSVIDAQNFVLNFQKSQDEFRFRILHISVPDSEMTVDSIKYYSLIDQEKFFAKSEFRQTRFRIDIPQIKIVGMDYLGLLRGKTYNARSISIHDIFADILINMDKPYDKNSTNPEMPNEILSSIKEIVKIDSLKIINGRLKYCERFDIGTTPGVVTFNKVNVSISGISNNKIHPDTTVITAGGIFMKSGIMKLHMAIPLASKNFSLRCSGSLGTMDITEINSFIEPAEHQRIESGLIQSAAFNISVNSGQANGTLRVVYKDLSLAVLNRETGSEKGIFNRIASFTGKTFVVRGTNIPDEEGLMKIGEIKYTRNPDEPFFQFLWFALRSGIGNLVGF